MNDILQYKGYFAVVHFSAKDEKFYGKLLGIDNLVLFDGTSFSGLMQSFHEAVDKEMGTVSDQAVELDKVYKGEFHVRIPPEIHKAAVIHVLSKHISLSEFVRIAICYALLHKDDLDKNIFAK